MRVTKMKSLLNPEMCTGGSIDGIGQPDVIL
jgi:hypothetical protein